MLGRFRSLFASYMASLCCLKSYPFATDNLRAIPTTALCLYHERWLVRTSTGARTSLCFRILTFTNPGAAMCNLRTGPRHTTAQHVAQLEKHGSHGIGGTSPMSEPTRIDREWKCEPRPPNNAMHLTVR